jgi:hypothetical protein
MNRLVDREPYEAAPTQGCPVWSDAPFLGEPPMTDEELIQRCATAYWLYCKRKGLIPTPVNVNLSEVREELAECGINTRNVVILRNVNGDIARYHYHHRSSQRIFRKWIDLPKH